MVYFCLLWNVLIDIDYSSLWLRVGQLQAEMCRNIGKK